MVVAEQKPKIAPYREIVDGEMCVNMHAGQMAAYNSKARTVLMLCGSQVGKTIFEPDWLLREIQVCGE